MTKRYGSALFTGAVLIVALTGQIMPVHAQTAAPALPATPVLTRTSPLPVAPVQAPAPTLPAQAPAPATPVRARTPPLPVARAQVPAPVAPTQPPAPAPPAPPQAPTPAAATAIPLQVQFVLTRYQGEKKLSSVPYTLSVSAGRERGGTPQARLRMGAQVAVPSTSFTPQTAGADGKPNTVVPLTSYNYRDIGTSIDTRALTLADGRFELTITVEDSSVFAEASADAGPRVANVPVFRTFSANSTLLLRDGQTGQFTTATDKINGEVLRIEVTVRVVK
jgi:hypothetical protein